MKVLVLTKGLSLVSFWRENEWRISLSLSLTLIVSSQEEKKKKTCPLLSFSLEPSFHSYNMKKKKNTYYKTKTKRLHFCFLVAFFSFSWLYVMFWYGIDSFTLLLLLYITQSAKVLEEEILLLFSCFYEEVIWSQCVLFSFVFWVAGCRKKESNIPCILFSPVWKNKNYKRFFKLSLTIESLYVSHMYTYELDYYTMTTSTDEPTSSSSSSDVMLV